MARLAFEQWQVDAVTVSPYLGQDLAARFLRYPNKAIFVSCYSANFTAQVIQTYPNEQTPLYLAVIRDCQGWASHEQLGLEIGGAHPNVLARVRSVAPERLILTRSIRVRGWETLAEDIPPILEAGLDASGGGLMLPVNQDVLTTEQPEHLVRSLRDQTNEILAHMRSRSLSCQAWVPDVCLLNHQPHADLILELFDLGCIQFGEYVQASGAVFPYYIDLRKIISNPQVFDAVIAAYADILQRLQFDRIAGIPYGSLPTASGLALRLNRPLIFPRKEVKAYGARRLVEGNYTVGETAVVVDDILISGKSAMAGAEKLKSCGIKVQDIVVFLDHGGDVCQRLAQHGYAAHAVLTLSAINDILYNSGRITESQFYALSQDAITAPQ
jgi:uridine monophosphate synthetase